MPTDRVVRRGPQRAPTRVQISVRLDRDLVETLHASAEGWQGRVNEVLRKVVLGKRRAQCGRRWLVALAMPAPTRPPLPVIRGRERFSLTVGMYGTHHEHS